MVSQFSSLLKPGSLDKLKAAIKTTTRTQGDEGYWKMTVDAAGNGMAVIRFLPAPPPETVGFCSYYRHAFKGPNGWYIENCLTSIDKDDPCVEYTSRLYATKNPTLEKQGSSQSRKLTYVSNIYVVQDKGNPANEGKVFLYRYGKKIMEKISRAANGDPDFPDDPQFDPFHVLEGANFRLRQKKQAGYPNYDDSAFEAPTPFLKGDSAAIFAAMEGAKSVAALVAPESFLDYSVLKKKLDRVMGFDTATYLTANDEQQDVPVAPTPRRRPVPQDDDAPVPSAARPWTPPVSDDDGDVDRRLSQFEDD